MSVSQKRVAYQGRLRFPCCSSRLTVMVVARGSSDIAEVGQQVLSRQGQREGLLSSRSGLCISNLLGELTGFPGQEFGALHRAETDHL
jgi:hypothetical protein